MLSISRTLKTTIKKIPGISDFARDVYHHFSPPPEFRKSDDYWEERYRQQGDSGDGSYGRLAEFKAEVLNTFVAEKHIQSIIEFGCGDGEQLTRANYPDYTGIDVSQTVLGRCRQKFAKDTSKRFYHTSEVAEYTRGYDLAISLDVLYHLVEDDVFETYMGQLFDSSNHWVIIYSSNKIDPIIYEHVKHRQFTNWIDAHAPQWTLERKIDQRYPYDPKHGDTTSFADFYIFQKSQSAE